MSVETATAPSGLNTAWPIHTDPLSEADSHLRLVKAVLKATFPNLSGPMTLTQGQLNALSAAVLTSGGQSIAGTTTFGAVVVGTAATSVFNGALLVVGNQINSGTHTVVGVSSLGVVNATSIAAAGAATVGTSLAVGTTLSVGTTFSVTGTSTMALVNCDRIAVGPVGTSLFNGAVNVIGAVTLGGSLSIDGVFIQTNGLAPASASAAGTAGQKAWDANFEYRCVATNTWKRAAHVTW